MIKEHYLLNGVQFEVTFDIDKAMQALAMKAYHNRSGVAKECSGAVVVRVIGNKDKQR